MGGGAFSVIINNDFNNTYAKILVKKNNRLYAEVSVGLKLVNLVNTQDIFKQNSQKCKMP